MKRNRLFRGRADSDVLLYPPLHRRLLVGEEVWGEGANLPQLKCHAVHGLNQFARFDRRGLFQLQVVNHRRRIMVILTTLESEV